MDKNYLITTFAVLLAVLILVVIIFVIRNSRGDQLKKNKKNINSGGDKKNIPCILCGAFLLRGEKLKSEEYKGEDSSIVHIHGCPYCTGEKELRIRRCPVCKKVLPDNGYLLAKMWKTRKGKMHLHVSGCVLCKPAGIKK